MSDALSTLRFDHGGEDLLLLLPGAYMQPQGFVAAGFPRAIARRQLALDLEIADLDLTRVHSAAALAHLVATLRCPTRAHYRHIWLGGISLGGYTALLLAADAPASVTGLCLLAPYPGSRITANLIAAAGGLGQWQASAEQRAADADLRLWHWLKAPPPELPVFIGYGTDDRFADGMARLAACFPEKRRSTVAGGHDWPAWRALWDIFLDHGQQQGHFQTRSTP